MKISIFSRDISLRSPNRLAREAQKRGHIVKRVYYEGLRVSLHKKTPSIYYEKKPLPLYDMAIFRNAGSCKDATPFIYQRTALVEYFTENAAVLNKESYYRWPNLNKIAQLFHLLKNKLPIVPSMLFSSQGAMKQGFFPYPFIIKPTFGSLGDGVVKISKEHELKSLLKKKKLHDLIFQEYIATREDYRVIVIGGKALSMVMKKHAPKNAFITNYAQGGTISAEEITSELRRLAEHTAEIFSADFAGIDIIYDAKGKPYILEINRNPNFKGFERVTNINVADKVIAYLEEKKRTVS